MEYRDYYHILGVERGATQDNIKRAYRRLARKYHPDVSSEADADARFKEVGEAYEVLKDPEKRAAYDQLGSNWRTGQEFRPPPGWNREFRFAGGMDGGHAFSDFFQAMFGDVGRFGEAGPQGGPFVDPLRGGRGFGGETRGQDGRAVLHVSLEQLAVGEPVEVTLGASGERDCKRLKVKVPKGLSDGQSFRLRGQGESGRGNGAAGDLYVEISLLPHPEFRAEGLDIHSEVKVAPWEAVLGTQVPVATLSGRVKLKIPAGTTAGTRMRLARRGLPGAPRGDHFATVCIAVPARVTARERALYESLAEASEFDPRA